MNLIDLLKGITPKEILGNTDIEINNIQFDSRKVQRGDMFVATRGTAVDGHDFIAVAIENGAAAIVCESQLNLPLSDSASPIECGMFGIVVVENSAEALGIIACNFYGNPSQKLKLVGVTGTNGKTTIATLLYKLFRELGYRAGLLSTVCNYVNDEAIEATHTTPDPLELNSLLAKMAAAGCQYAFMEVSSHAVEQRRIAGLEFVGGIFTNLTQDHLDYHKTMENYRDAKKMFFDNLPKTAFAITNIDDKNGEFMLQNTRAQKFTYSLQTMADFRTRILEHDFNGMLLSINTNIKTQNAEQYEVYTNFVGRFNAYNLTAVFGAAMLLAQKQNDSHCGQQLQIGASEILRILSMLKSVSGRFETIRAPQGFTAIVDYAHTPDALTNVISTINDILQQTNGRLITVVGCGGNRDKGKRPIMAREAVEGSWKAILTSDNPRKEDPQEILNDMLAGLDDEQKRKSLTIIDRSQAIKTACSLAQKGDVVLIAGKGHENYQIIGEIKHHFDDKEEVLEIIKK
ncbi:MAG: UDP-N-acetylmuramoyl-L-alanyl-D-glutamate--2,6-diaminopimelate ligase [Paludibacter sp.]|nr:UDP-N-acetylmuramoyl-L-alanyl-D-glutamate--2,6-diaminopimelate ligase [Paludibacter sp.]